MHAKIMTEAIFDFECRFLTLGGVFRSFVTIRFIRVYAYMIFLLMIWASPSS